MQENEEIMTEEDIAKLEAEMEQESLKLDQEMDALLIELSEIDSKLDLNLRDVLKTTAEFVKAEADLNTETEKTLDDLIVNRIEEIVEQEQEI